MQEQAELLATDAGGNVHGADPLIQAARDFLQADVADPVTIGIVDGLEAIEIKAEQRGHAMVALRMREGVAQFGFEQSAVRQACEQVVICLVGEPHMKLLSLGDVLDEREGEIRAVAGERMGRDIDEAQAPVAFAMLFNGFGIFGLSAERFFGGEVVGSDCGNFRKCHR